VTGAEPKVRRPALRYHGGKWLLAPWIISQMPAHRVYVEPFGGAASVLLRKPRAYAEIYNDLDGEIVEFFRVLRDPVASAELRARVALTPFARAEFEAAYEWVDCAIERARRLLIRSFMGFGSDGFNSAVKTGFRANSNRSGTTPAHDWVSYAGAMPALTDRFAGVVIESDDALAVMARNDQPQALHYVDPPYLPETRSEKSRRGGARYHAYRHELTVADHQRLLQALRELRGMVILSGYPAPQYDAALVGWKRVERAALADGAKPRVEVLWLNPPLVKALERSAHRSPLFEAAE
jgi:DNA adenine methylase